MVARVFRYTLRPAFGSLPERAHQEASAMAIEHARVCGACEQEVPSWASRCPVCGDTSLISRITIIPPAAIATITEAKASRTKSHRRRAAGGLEPTTPARSTA